MLKPTIHLKKGGWAVASGPETIVADLGSCVSVCVLDCRNRWGGAVHFLLPADGPSALAGLISGLKKRGSERDDLVAYVLGGCLKPEPGPKAETGANEIARRNAETARHELARYGIPIRKSRVGVVCSGMRFRFSPADGSVEVQMREVAASAAPGPGKVRVLVVDDSAPIRKILCDGMARFPELEVVGCAADAYEAENLRKQLKPHALTLDINMPGKDGITYLKELRAHSDMPVVLVSDLSPNDARPVLEALEHGAFDFVHKPALGQTGERLERLRDLLVAAVGSRSSSRERRFHAAPVRCRVRAGFGGPRLIAIGASTGGTEALRSLFAQLPAETPPILVVQHMPPVFTQAFAESLGRLSAIAVREAVHGEELKASTAYIAPGGAQMRIVPGAGTQLRIEITDDAPVNRFKPSVDFLFRSIAGLSVARRTRAALLTGMGEDGARGLGSIREAGGITVAQDEETCVVFGMPKAAIALGAAREVLPLWKIAGFLLGMGTAGKGERSVA